MNNKRLSSGQSNSEKAPHSHPRDDRFADPATDVDPRTSDEGVTSTGGSDLNLDEATINTDSPDAVPGVRHG